MAEQRRFGVLSSCLVIAWVIAVGTAENNATERGNRSDSISRLMRTIVRLKLLGIKFRIRQNNDNNKTHRKCVTPAHPRPPLEPIPTCMPYKYGEEGVCSSVIGDRLIYGSLQTQDSMERLLMNFTRARAYALFKDDISERCLKTVEVIYCNHYFQRCDNAFSTILPVPVCREACDVMVQQHCKEEYQRAYEINKAVQGSKATSRQLQWAFDLINCTALPGRNGGTIPECYYPRELEGNTPKEEFSETCSYGDGQSYRGNVSVTQSGYTCQSWSSQCPHRHHRTPDNYPELVNASNACRNPGGQAPHGPWCYTTNASVRWEYCNISTCPPEDATLSDWSPFTNCSVSCGRGFKTRYRSCIRSRFGEKDCASFGALTEQQPCNVHNCSGRPLIGKDWQIYKIHFLIRFTGKVSEFWNSSQLHNLTA
ncbi:muscle, skeletal receptor tyrosine protein kinase-like [Oculina patagonica]